MKTNIVVVVVVSYSAMCKLIIMYCRLDGPVQIAQLAATSIVWRTEGP